MKDVRKLLGYQPTFYYEAGHWWWTPGKRTPDIPGIGVIHEHEFNRPVADQAADLLEAIGFRVFDAAPDSGKEISLQQRSNRINIDFINQRKLYPSLSGKDVGVGLSFHFNAFDGEFNKKAGGLEVHHDKPSTNGKRFAEILVKHLQQGTDQVNRGPKHYNLHMTRETYPVYCLAEFGFMDVLKEAKLMKDKAFQLECATEVAAAVCDYFGLDYQDILNGEDKTLRPILEDATATIKQAQAWAKAKGATEEFISLAPLYWAYCSKVGVNPVGSYAQAAKETGYGKFGGVIDASYHNPCGLKVTQGGGNYDPNAHKRFKDWEEGVEAHVDHDAIYAGAPGYPRKDTPDPRHFTWIYAKAKHWEDLGGRWAPSSTYGESIVNMMEQIEATVVESAPEVDQLLQELADAKAQVKEANLKLEKLGDENEKIRSVVKTIQEVAGGIKL